MLNFLKRYAKAAGGVMVTVAAYVASVMTDGVTPQEWVLVAGAFFTAVGVGVVPNLDEGIARYAKGAVAFFVAGTASLSILILGGLTPVEVVEVVAAALGAVGVTLGLRNAPDTREG